MFLGRKSNSNNNTAGNLSLVPDSLRCMKLIQTPREHCGFNINFDFLPVKVSYTVVIMILVLHLHPPADGQSTEKSKWHSLKVL